MKKIISLILITIMSLNLVACGGDVKVQKASDEEKAAMRARLKDTFGYL